MNEDDEKCNVTRRSDYNPDHQHVCRTKAKHAGFHVCVCGALFGVAG